MNPRETDPTPEPASERIELAGWTFETGPGFLRGAPGSRSRLRSGLAWASVPAIVLGVLLAPPIQEQARASRRLQSVWNTLRYGWPAGLIIPIGWYFSSGKILVDRKDDRYQFGHKKGRASEIQVIWLASKTSSGWLAPIDSELRAGLADGRVVKILRSESQPDDVERVGIAIAGGLEVPLQRIQED